MSNPIENLKQKILKSFNISLLKEFQNRLNFPINDGRLKYFNYDYEFSSKCFFALEMGLDNNKHFDILDISCGMGYFSYICKSLGHRIISTDIEDPVYDEPLRKIFGIEKLIFEYPNDPWRFKALPENIGTFDAIAALSVVPMSFWEQKDWNLFIEDSMNHMNINGILYIRPNSSKGLEQLKSLAPKSIHYKKHTNDYVLFIKR